MLLVLVSLGLSYGLVILLAKLSVLLLLHNLFSVNKRMILLGIAVSFSFCVALTVYNIAGEVDWVDAASLQHHICVKSWIVTIATGAINTSTDLYNLVLPIAVVLRLQLTLRRKLGVVLIFIIGLL